MRRLLVLLLIASLAALIGCGGGSVGDGTTQAAAAAPAAPRPAAPRRAASRAPPEPVRLTVLASGDFLIHSPVWQRALALGGGSYDFAPLFRYIAPYVRGADIALCHVETPLASGPPSGYPVFNTPQALAAAIRSTGWDACSTASNHSLDQGQRGIDETAATLDRAGIAHTGSFATSRGPGRTLLIERKGVRIALLAYTEMTNGIPAPHPWSVNVARAERIVADAKRARARGADAVLVNLHWGDEYGVQPSAFQRDLADRLTRSPAITAIVGQHVHVVQPIARVNGKAVVFGEGNLISNQTPGCCAPGAQDGLLARLQLVVDRAHPRRTGVRGVTYVPTWVRHPDYAVLPIGPALRNGLADAAELRASYARTVAAAGRRPGIAPEPARLP